MNIFRYLAAFKDTESVSLGRLTLAEEIQEVVHDAKLSGSESPRVLRPRPRTSESARRGVRTIY